MTTQVKTNISNETLLSVFLFLLRQQKNYIWAFRIGAVSAEIFKIQHGTAQFIGLKFRKKKNFLPSALKGHALLSLAWNRFKSNCWLLLKHWLELLFRSRVVQMYPFIKWLSKGSVVNHQLSKHGGLWYQSCRK